MNVYRNTKTGATITTSGTLSGRYWELVENKDEKAPEETPKKPAKKKAAKKGE